MRGGLAAPMALAVGMVLALLPATVPPAPRRPPAPQAKPAQIASAKNSFTEAAYARPAAVPKLTGKVTARGAPAALRSRRRS